MVFINYSFFNIDVTKKPDRSQTLTIEAKEPLGSITAT